MAEQKPGDRLNTDTNDMRSEQNTVQTEDAGEIQRTDDVKSPTDELKSEKSDNNNSDEKATEQKEGSNQELASSKVKSIACTKDKANQWHTFNTRYLQPGKCFKNMNFNDLKSSILIPTTNTCFHAAVVDEKVWIPTADFLSTVYVLNQDMSLKHMILFYKDGIEPRSFVQKKFGQRNLIVACTITGLHELQADDGRYVKHIWRGSFCDVAADDENIYALHTISQQVFLYQEEETQEGDDSDLKMICSIQLPSEFKGKHNTLLPTNDKRLLVCSFNTGYVCFCFTGDNKTKPSVLQKLTTTLLFPLLCGIDEHKHILMIGYGDERVVCWESDTGKLDEIEYDKSKGLMIRDVIFHRGEMWVLCKGGFAVAKCSDVFLLMR